MSAIGTAFVQVKPDLSEFQSQLIKDLERAKAKIPVAVRTIEIRAAFSAETKAALEKQVAKLGPIAIPVQLLVSPNAAASIAKQVGPVVIPVTTNVVGGKTKFTGEPSTVEIVPSLVANARATLETQLAGQGGVRFFAVPDLVANAKTLLTEQLAAQGSIPFSAIPVIDAGAAEVALTTQAAALKSVPITGGAVEKATKRVSREAAAAPVDVSLAVLKVTEDLKVATGELAQADLILTDAQNAAALSAKELEAAQASGNARLIRAATSTDAGAKKALSDAGAQRDAAKIRDEANKAATASAERLASAQAIANQSLQKTQGVVVGAANAEDLLRSNKAAATAVSSKYTAAIAAENFVLADQIDLVRQDLVAEEARIRGRVALSKATALAANVGLQKGATPIDTAQLASKDAVDADTAAQKANEIALVSRNEELIRQSAALAQNTALEKERRAATLGALEVDKARQPLVAALGRISEAQALANDASLTTAARVTQAARAHTLAVAAVDKFSAATSVATAEEIKHFQTLEVDTAALLENAKAQNTAAVASARTAKAIQTETASRATLTSQAVRGTAATGATFLGLRGAVLSASTGFLAATVLLTGISKIIKTAEDLTRQLNIFQSVSNATAAQMAAVSLKAKQLGADLSLPATSATDAAEAMTELQKAGLSVNNTLGAAKGVLQLSAAANLSNVDAAKIVATQLNAFGLAGTEATRVVDLLAGASIAAQGEISDFALAFQQVAAVANQVGLPVETATAILTQFAQAGIRGSDAGTSLRTLLLRLVPTTKAAADAQADLGIKLDKSIPIGLQFTNLVDQYTAALAKLGPVAQQESLTKIFGQDAIRGASVSLTSGSDALVKLQATVSQAGSAARLTEGRVKGLSGSVEGLKSNVSTLAATIGEEMLPLLDSLAHTFSSIATQANTVATALSAIANTTIKPIGNLLGGTDALAEGGVALAATLGARKLLRDRADKKAAAAINQSILEIKLRMTDLGVTEEEVSRLFSIMGITAEEANLRAARAQATLNKEISITNAQLVEGLALVEQDLLSRSAPSQAARIAAVQTEVEAIKRTEANKTAQVVAEARARSAASEIASTEKVAATVALTNEEELIGVRAVTAAIGLQIKALITLAGSWVGVGAAAAGATVLERRATLPGAIPPVVPPAGRFGKLGKIGGRGISGKGLGIGIGATIAGELIGGRAGGVLSAAGTGATFGSFLGPEGAVVGGAAFGAFELLQQSKEESRKKQEKLKESFQAMTPQEQRDFIARLFPDKANKNIQNDVLSLLARTKRLPPTRVNPEGKVETARDFIKKLGGLNEEDRAALAALRARNRARRALADEATKGVIPLPSLRDFASPPIPPGGPSPAAATAIGRAQFAQGPFGTIPVLTPQKVSPPKIEIDKRVIEANKRALRELAEATTGDTSELAAIALADVNEKQSLVDRLKARLANLKPPSTATGAKDVLAFVKAQAALIKLLTAAAKDLAKDVNVLNEVQIAAINTQSFAVQIGELKAEGTKTLVDDLAIAQKALDDIEKKRATSQKAREAKALAAQGARNKITGIEDQIATDQTAKSDKAKQAANNAAQVQIDNLRFFADKAGNVGKAEEALLKALQHQVDIAKRNTPEFISARAALDAERQKHIEAIAGKAQLNDDLRQSIIDAAQSAADLTDTNADDIRADKMQLKLANSRLNAAVKFGETLDKQTDKWKKNQIKVNGLKAARDAALGALKQDQGASGGGFSLADFFNEVVSEAKQFGSNIAPRGGILSPQDARGAFSNQVIANNPLVTIGRSQLTEQQKTNQILTGIATRRNGSNSPNRDKSDRVGHPENANRGSTNAIEHAAYLKDITG